MSIPKVKLNNGLSIANALNGNNISLGFNEIYYQESSISGWYMGIENPQYTIYARSQVNPVQPNIWATSGTSDTEILNFINRTANVGGVPFTSTTEAFYFVGTRAENFIIKGNYPDITLKDLVLNYDTGTLMGYPWSGNTVYDLSPSQSNTTLSGSPTYNPLYNGILEFNGTNQYGYGPDLGQLSAFTVNTWFRLDSIPNPSEAPAIITEKFISNHLGFVIGFIDSPQNGDISGGFFNNGWYKTASFTPVLSTWYNVTLTYDNASLSLYIDGVLFDSVPVTEPAISSGLGYNVGKRWDSDDFINGQIQVVQIYNRALTDGEISNSYTRFVPRFIPPSATPTPTPENLTPTPTPTPTITQTSSPVVSGNVQMDFYNDLTATTVNNIFINGVNYSSGIFPMLPLENGTITGITQTNNEVGLQIVYDFPSQGTVVKYIYVYVDGSLDFSGQTAFDLTLTIGTTIPVQNNSVITVRQYNTLLSPTPTPTNTSTPTNTPTPSVTETNTPTPTETETPTPTPTNTPTPSVTPPPVTGYSFNLVDLPYNFPSSGNSIMNNSGDINTGSTEINLLTTNGRGFYFNSIDSNGFDRTNYFSAFTGQNITITFTQTGNTAIYSGDTNSFKHWIQAPNSGFVFGTGVGVPPSGTPSGTALLIQSATTQFTIGLPVYVSVQISGNVTPTPTPTNTSTPTQTNTSTTTPTVTSTVTPTSSGSGEVLINPIITEFDEYIEVGNNLYLMFAEPIGPTPTPTPTATETQTPTPTETITQTPTPEPTTTPTSSETPTPTPTPDVTPSPTTTETPTATSEPTTTPTSTQTSTPTTTPQPTPTPSSGPVGAGWFFYTPEGVIQGPPTSNGDTIFLANGVSTFNPNFTGTPMNMFWNVNDSNGTSYSTQFQALDTTGGTITMTQGGVSATLSGDSTTYNFTGQYLGLNVNSGVQLVQSAATPFISGSPITLTFNGQPISTPTQTPSNTATPVTPTPTPTKTSSPTPTPTITPTNTETPTATPSQTPTGTPTPTITPSPTTPPSKIIVAAGGVNAIGYSYDGDNWFNSSNGSTFLSQPALAVGASPSLFVAGGSPSTNPLIYSTDGDTWVGSSNGSSVFNSVRGVAFGGGKWVAVGISTSASAGIGYSLDGITWSASTFTGIFGSVVTSVAFNGSRWVATAQAGGGANPKNTIAYSDDGITWSASSNSTTIFTTSGRGVTWGGNKWVAVGDGTNRFAYSNDGITWSGSSSGNALMSALGNGVGFNGTQFVGCGQGTNQLIYSNDGITWSASTNGNTIFSLVSYCVTWDGEQWIAGGIGTNQLAKSSDGITWSTTTNGNTIMNNTVRALASKI